MKILMITHDPVFPERSGQRVRTASLLRALRTAHEVELMAPVEGGNAQGTLPATRPSRLRMGLAWATGKSVWKERFHLGPATRAIAQASSRGFDLVVCAGLPSAFRLPELPRSMGVWIDEQNVEWRLVERAAAVRKGLSRLAILREARALREAESGVLSRADFVTSCSEEDARVLEVGQVLANPAPTPAPDFQRRPDPSVLLFSGTLCWGPNVDAACWMAREILPLVRRSRPDAVLRLVGRDPSPQVQALASVEGVQVVGTVDSMWDELSRAAVSVAPIRMGSGTRIKILEAAMASVPVVSTTVGAEGLDFAEGTEILRADHPEAFAKACLGLLGDPARAQAMGLAARERCEHAYGARRFTDRVLELADLAAQARGRRGA